MHAKLTEKIAITQKKFDVFEDTLIICSLVLSHIMKEHHASKCMLHMKTNRKEII